MAFKKLLRAPLGRRMQWRCRFSLTLALTQTGSEGGRCAELDAWTSSSAAPEGRVRMAGVAGTAASLSRDREETGLDPSPPVPLSPLLTSFPPFRLSPTLSTDLVSRTSVCSLIILQKVVRKLLAGSSNFSTCMGNPSWAFLSQ